MNPRIFCVVAAALALTFTARANAGIVGSTYDFTASTTGTTTLIPLIGPTSFTDPSNPGFCVGAPTDCTSATGVDGSFVFADLTPSLSTIKFNLFGSTSLAVTGSFSIDLGNFVTTDGSKITDVTYGSGNLSDGNFSNVTWNGTDAVFTGTPDQLFGYNSGFLGTSVTFDVAIAQVPEPSSLILLGTALLGFVAFGANRWRHKRA